MPSNVVHGRQSIAYLSTSSGSTSFGNEIGYVEDITIDVSREVNEIPKINANSMEYIEGLISGSVSANGHFRVGDTILHKLINRFAKLSLNDTSDTSQDAIKDGDLFIHDIVKPIDTAASSDDIDGAKYVIPVLSNGFSVNMNAGSPVGWTYNGTQNGDLLYVESTSTARGIPKA
jgi:hypothetical protein